MSSVWAVTRGEYSDFAVIAVFAEKSDAEAAVNDGMGDDVEELDFYVQGVKPRKIANAIYACHLDKESGAMMEGWPLQPMPDREVKPTVDVAHRHPDGRDEPRRISTLATKSSWGNWLIQVSGPHDSKTRKAFHDFVAKTRAEIVEGHR